MHGRLIDGGTDILDVRDSTRDRRCCPTCGSLYVDPRVDPREGPFPRRNMGSRDYGSVI